MNRLKPRSPLLRHLICVPIPKTLIQWIRTPRVNRAKSASVFVLPGIGQKGDSLVTRVSKRNDEALSQRLGTRKSRQYSACVYVASEPSKKWIPPTSRTNARGAAQAVEQMILTAKAQGVELWVDSGHRSYPIQCYLFNRKMRIERGTFRRMKTARKKAIDSVNSRSAFPGHSEHQLGTAVDLVTNIPEHGLCSRTSV